MLEFALWVIALAAGSFVRAKLFPPVDLVAKCQGFEAFRCGVEEVGVPLVVLEAAESALVGFEVVSGRCLKITVSDTMRVSLYIRTC